MVNKQLITSSLIAALAGAAFFYLLKWFWAYIPNYNPIFDWLLDCCAASSWVRSVILLQDICINILLALPLALLLMKLRPKQAWWYLSLSIIPSLIWSNHHLFHSRTLDPSYAFSDLIPGLAMELLIVPIALVIVMLWQIFRARSH